MKVFLFIITLCLSCTIFSQRLIVNGHRYTSVPATPDSVYFSFGLTARGTTGVTEIVGHPHTETRSGTAKGITVSTGSTSNWTPEASATAANGAAPNCGIDGWNPVIGLDYMFNKKSSAPASSSQAHLTISGLVPGATYRLECLGSRTTADPTRQMYYHLIDASGAHTSTILDAKGNTANLRTFSAVANSSGEVYLSAYGAGTHANALYGYFNGLKITWNL